MRLSLPRLALPFLLLPLLPTEAVAQDGPISLTLLRTRGQSGMTQVDAVAEIDPQQVVTNGSCAYVVQITISRGDGGIVAEESWPRAVPCPADGDSALRFVDTFSFIMGRSLHRVEMAIMPAGDAARRMSVRVAVEPLPRGARVSDLYLAREIAWDTTGRDWPIRKGGLALAAEAVVDVPMDRPLLAYYVEVYAEPANAGAAGVVDAVIRRQGSDRSLVTFPLHEFDSLTESRPVAGTISVAGLPEGAYEMEVNLRVGGSPVVSREQPFRVRRARPAPRPMAQQTSPDAVQRYFAGLNAEELSRFDPVVLWMSSAAARESFTQMDSVAKRTFLANFFSTVEAPGQEAGADPLREFLSRATDVERHFGPRAQEGRAGWRTDRGRLWIQYGAPADRIRRPFPVADTRPYEIWYYDIGAGYVYLFVDEGGFGDYRLLYSTDPQEPTVPGWSARAGAGAVEELSTYYGIQRPGQ